MPWSLHRQNLRCVFFQPPYYAGKSLHSAPVRKIQTTAFIKLRLSLACPPQLPFLPGNSGSNFFQNSSDMSCLCMLSSSILILHLLLLCSQYNMFFVTTLSRFRPRRFSQKNYGGRIGSSADCISVCVFPHLRDLC